MSHRTEIAEFTVLCLIHDKDRILLQDRISEDWKGYTLPGGMWSFCLRLTSIQEK